MSEAPRVVLATAAPGNSPAPLGAGVLLGLEEDHGELALATPCSTPGKDSCQIKGGDQSGGGLGLAGVHTPEENVYKTETVSAEQTAGRRT